MESNAWTATPSARRPASVSMLAYANAVICCLPTSDQWPIAIPGQKWRLTPRTNTSVYLSSWAGEDPFIPPYRYHVYTVKGADVRHILRTSTTALLLRPSPRKVRLRRRATTNVRQPYHPHIATIPCDECTRLAKTDGQIRAERRKIRSPIRWARM